MGIARKIESGYFGRELTFTVSLDIVEMTVNWKDSYYARYI